MKRRALGILLGFAAAMTAGRANAVLLNFEGLGNDDSVGSFYNGGSGGSLGITFDGFKACVITGSQCTAISNEPSPNTVILVDPNKNGLVDVSGGFTTFSFHYSACCADNTVVIWSGLDGTGSMLASVTLPQTGADPNSPAYSIWQFVNVPFAGQAFSIEFQGDDARLITLDDFTLTNDTHATPEPLTLSLFGAGLAGMAASRRRRKSV